MTQTVIELELNHFSESDAIKNMIEKLQGHIICVDTAGGRGAAEELTRLEPNFVVVDRDEDVSTRPLKRYARCARRCQPR